MPQYDTSPRSLLPFMDKECGDVNGTCKRPQFAVKNADFPHQNQLFPC